MEELQLLLAERVMIRSVLLIMVGTTLGSLLLKMIESDEDDCYFICYCFLLSISVYHALAFSLPTMGYCGCRN